MHSGRFLLLLPAVCAAILPADEFLILPRVLDAKSFFDGGFVESSSFNARSITESGSRALGLSEVGPSRVQKHNQFSNICGIRSYIFKSVTSRLIPLWVPSSRTCRNISGSQLSGICSLEDLLFEDDTDGQLVAIG